MGHEEEGWCQKQADDRQSGQRVVRQLKARGGADGNEGKAANTASVVKPGEPHPIVVCRGRHPALTPHPEYRVPVVTGASIVEP